MDKLRKSESIFMRCTGQSTESLFSPTNSKDGKESLEAKFQKEQAVQKIGSGSRTFLIGRVLYMAPQVDSSITLSALISHLACSPLRRSARP